MKESVVIIGANEYQNCLIEKAKERGYETHVFAWRSGAVGESTADFFYPVSITDRQTILRVCSYIKPVGIASIGSDLAVPTVNYVAQRMGLTANSVYCGRISTKKHLMREAFRRGGDPSPRSIPVTSGEEIPRSIVEQWKFPLIVKPSDRSGSRGITKIDGIGGLAEALEEALRQSLEKKAVIEEFAEGREYSVEFISWQGKHTFLALTEKFTTGAPHFIETGHLQPAEMDEKSTCRIIEVISHALDTLKIQYGASHAEIKIDEKGTISIIEIGSRMGGDFIGSDLTYLSTGMDYVGMVLDIACGKEPDFTPLKTPEYAFVRFLFHERDRSLYEQIKAEHPRAIYRADVSGKNTGTVTDSSSRPGYYILRDSDRERLGRLVLKLMQTDGHINGKG